MHYILLVVFFTLLSRKSKAGNILFIFFSLILIIFAFLSRQGSWDYFGYEEYYRCALLPQCDQKGVEFSFFHLSRIANFIANGWGGIELVFLFYIISSILLKVYLIKSQSKAFGISILAFVCHAYFIHDLTQIRASLAIAILWHAYFQFSNKKIIFGFLLTGLATFFHVSALAGLVFFFIKKIKPKLLLISTFPAALLGQYLANGGLTSLPTLPFERLDIYIAAIGSEALVSSQFNFYALTMFFVAFIGIKNGVETWSDFERFGINSMLLGLILYLGSYFVPIVPVRLLEFFSCLYPFVTAAAYASSRRYVEKISLIFIFICLFSNTAIRNNTRLDMIFSWQTINMEYMTEIQIDQLMQMLP